MQELQEEQGLAHVYEGVVRGPFTPCARNVICTCEMSSELGPVQEMSFKCVTEPKHSKMSAKQGLDLNKNGRNSSINISLPV